ncbi:MAG TPA: TetR/AcrR family transcriptional regulator [Steroidobacteraceae bacterium]|nr:TetR/AcrR family transcriptional regulator [Steroidobacteraceae bacterium]
MSSPSAATARPKRKPGRPRSQRSEEAIIRATTSLLADERYADLTVSKVAARARASKSTIYRRWPTKEHLVIEAFNRWPELQAHDRGDVMSDLLDLQRQFLRILHRPPSNAIMPTLVAERAHNPALAAVFDPLMQRRRQPVRKVLERAMARGELPQDTDVELTVDAIMGMTVLRMYFMPGDLGVPAIREFLTVLLRGLGARGY